MTTWWWHLPKDGEIVPEYPPLDVTGRAATRDDLTCGRWCINTPAGPCDEQCVMEWIAADEAGAPETPTTRPRAVAGPGRTPT